HTVEPREDSTFAGDPRLARGTGLAPYEGLVAPDMSKIPSFSSVRAALAWTKKTSTMRLVAFGAGYVGLVTGTGLSERGHDVLTADHDADKITKLNDGLIPIHEPGLADLVRRNRRSGRLAFATTVTHPYDEADLYFIAVGTPQGPDGAADTSAVFT